MVYSEIFIIRGIVVDRAQLIEFVLRDPELRTAMLETETEEHFRTVTTTSEDFWEGIPYWGDDFIMSWPCCSPLRTKQFLLGYRSGTMEPEDIMNTIVDVASLGQSSRDEETLLRLKGAGLEGPLRSIIMLNDCTHCS